MQERSLSKSANTNKEDARSVFSGKTLLGIQEEKGKGLPVEAAVRLQPEDGVEPTGCFSGMFFNKGGKYKPSKEPSSTITIKCRHIKLPLTQWTYLSPRRLIAAHKERKGNRIYNAVRGGDLALFEKLTSKRFGAKFVQTDGHHILAEAISEDSDNVVRSLLKKGVSPDNNESCQPTPLIAAIQRNFENTVAALIEGGADIQKANKQGEKPIHLAANCGSPSMIRLLVNAGADTEATDGKEMRPLHHATHGGQTDNINALIELGADVDAAGPFLNRPLHYAVERGGTVSVAQTLLSAGANVNSTNLKHCTPLHLAAKLSRTELVPILLSQGADIEAPKARWETPLKYAVTYGRLAIVKQLLAAGADPNALTCEGKTALHSAAGHESDELVKTLLDGGADIDPRGTYGSTPLYLAAQNGRIRSAQLLIEAGADLYAERKGHRATTGRSVKEAAQKAGNLEIVRLLETAEQGLPLGQPGEAVGKLGTPDDGVATDVLVEDAADKNTCSWNEWFEKYIVKVYN
jgi:ankyrin repeat protein